MKAIVLGGTSGIGKSIATNLDTVCREVIRLGSKDLDTTSNKSVNNFCNKYKSPDILVLNTGGPKDIKFNKISDKEWIQSFQRLFLSFFNNYKESRRKKKWLYIFDLFIYNKTTF